MAATPLRIPGGRMDRALRARAHLVAALTPRIEAARRTTPRGLLGQLALHRDDAGRFLPTEDIAAHLLLLFWAGYDTTASSVTWLLHVLARRPDWQSRLRNELDAVLGDGPLDVRTSHRLTELGWFLKEVERLYPSALFFPRVTLEPVDHAGYTIPKGATVFYSPYLSHRDPDAFDHPKRP